MASDPLRFHRRLAGVGVLLTVLEAGAVAGPLAAFYFFELDGRQRHLLYGLGPLIVLFAWLIWWVALRAWLAPIDGAVRRRRAGELLDHADAESIYHSILTLPHRAAGLRAALAGVVAALLGGLLSWRTGFPLESAATAVVVCTAHMLGVEVFRALAYARILDRVRIALVVDVDPLRLFRDRYRARLLHAGFATGALGLTAIAAFSCFFLPLNLEQYLRLERWVPLTAALLTGLWLLASRRIHRPIDAYLAAATSPDPRAQPGAADPRALSAYRAAQWLPYQYALAKIGLWIAAEVLLAALGTLRLGIDLENAVLLFGEALVNTVGVALYEVLWHRATMRPLLTHIATRHRPRPEAVRTPLSLRNKMLAFFGGLTFFACGLSLFWSFVQYKTLATGFIQRESALRLDRLLADLRVLADRGGRAFGPPAVDRALAESPQDEAVLYYLPPGEGTHASAYGGGQSGAPPLPRDNGEELMRRRPDGQMELSALHLSGAYARLAVERPDGRRVELGAIAVLYPGYRGRGPALDRQIEVLLLFFVLLAGASMAIVVLVVTDLTAPIRHLERRAGAMAQGDLTRPVIHVAGEADEVGRLTFAFEEMRRALNDKLRSSTEINLSLEQEVRRRTSELEKSNQELKDALDALKRAQAELVRSEKMASMGRLVAGIAHEINNPVNAVVNTAGPLAETLDELIGRTGELRPAEAAGYAADVREMIRVIQRGARRTKEIVQALHNYSRGDDDHLVDVDLHRGIDESLDLLRHHLKHGISVERSYGEVGRVRGYAGPLHQVFMNLLTNAAQALSEQRERAHAAGAPPPPGAIRIATRREDGNAIVTVSDDGPGIPPDVLPRIFDPFFTTKDVGQGSGLGLSIVHGIVERHGGTISVDSAVGRGTTFTVTLPAGDGEGRPPPAP